MDRKRAEFFKKAEAGCEDWSSDENRELLRYVSFYSTNFTQNILFVFIMMLVLVIVSLQGNDDDCMRSFSNH